MNTARAFILPVIAYCLLVTSATADVPQLINYQGRLLDGTNLVNNSVGLSLRLFNVASGGSSFYEDSNSVTVVDGLYSTFIGDNSVSGSLISALTNTEVWIETAVNGVTLSPRERLVSAGYSLATRGILVQSIGLLVVTPGQNSADASANFSTIAGGLGNQLYEDAFSSFLGGGSGDIIGTNSSYSFLGCGYFNTIQEASQKSFLGGGERNSIQANSEAAVIVGGFSNSVSGSYGAVLGGDENVATTNSFAAGHRAKAVRRGSFVWADSTEADFAATSSNQFLIRASGNVGININNPEATLHVAGEAVIGPSSNAPRFAMEIVALSAGGLAFRHPADTNLSMTWDSANRILTVTNAASPYYDVQMQLIEESNSVGKVVSRDISASVSPNFVRLTNSIPQNAGWSVTATKEASAQPGFQFNGSAFGNRLNGLIIYWY